MATKKQEAGQLAAIGALFWLSDRIPHCKTYLSKPYFYVPALRLGVEVMLARLKVLDLLAQISLVGRHAPLVLLARHGIASLASSASINSRSRGRRRC
jgi:hypothetical protein